MARQAKTPRQTKSEPDTAPRARMQVLGSEQQAETLAAAAAASGTDRSTYILAHALAAARAGDKGGGPMVLPADMADRIRAAAKRQGCTPQQLIGRWMVTSS